MPASPSPPRERVVRLPQTDSREHAAGGALIAPLVPILGALVLWAVTGSLLTLWFAALGPLMLVGGVVDRRWLARRARRRRRRADVRRRSEALRSLAEAHERERTDRWLRAPDIWGLLSRPQEIWRHVPPRVGWVVFGSGRARSETRVEGTGDDAGLADEADVLCDAPVGIPLRGRIDVCGSATLAQGAMRAILAQVCLVHPPGRWQVLGAVEAGFPEVAALPHVRVGAPRRLHVGVADAAHEVVRADDVQLILSTPALARGESVVHLGSAPQQASARVVATIDVSGDVVSAAPQLLSATQLAVVAGILAEQWREPVDGGPMALADLLESGEVPPDAAVGLPVPIGVARDAVCEVDLVRHGPHAVVTGVTGAGKSELLRTWVIALCARYSPEQVNIALADFKGGTAFAALAALPHVAGLITDLDDATARRALLSLRAEIRYREAALVADGVREIGESGALPRLVVVVDEFAALMNAHAELAALFVDLAARGRALGIHLILGTQRAQGVFRDALLANCPLRLSLRAADAADSRLMLDTDDAASLPSGVGAALLRRAGDVHARGLRVVAADDEVLSTAVGRWDHHPIRPPWLPPLPEVIALADLPRLPGTFLLGVADEPDLQRQRPIGIPAGARGMCVVGATGSGTSTALATVAEQQPDPLEWISAADLEHAWDVLSATSAEPRRGLVIDGADALLARFPQEYAAAALRLIEQIVRAGGGGRPVLLGAEHLGGALARVADLLPHRLLLRQRSKSDHLAHGGRPELWSPNAPSGRGHLDGLEVHVARAALPDDSAPARVREVWTPTRGRTAWVTRDTPRARATAESWEAAGIGIRGLGEPDSAGSVVRADPDGWQRAWGEFTAMRLAGTVLIDVSCAAEYRVLTGERELAPYCDPGSGASWLLEPGARVRRVHTAPER
ncbi:FtsK/SpoIIIE domain-containing protein [Microbacterium sediminicola]|uniref:FtsK/SpoIIIE domain-containing protein n=1 Tax=Microbacterium sediminicola TaxID=415210 RepID=UPI0031D8DD5F